MLLIIRGHIRNSFESKDLLNFIKNIYNLVPDLKIYIHTWNIHCNNLSWDDKIQTDNRIVNEEIIYDYFEELKLLIENIIIDDDSKIELIGNLNGKINDGPMPLIGWKNFWYGKYKIINYLYENNINDDIIVNLRFDILENSNNFDENLLINFIKNNIEKKITKNIFIFDDESHFGIDNIYIGNINTMHKLIKYFFYDLDNILSKNNDTIHQEFLVYRINNFLFD